MTVKLMTTNHLGDIEYTPGEGFGYGFGVVLDAGIVGTPVNEGQFSWGGAYHSTYWVDPEEEMVWWAEILGKTGGGSRLIVATHRSSVFLSMRAAQLGVGKEGPHALVDCVGAQLNVTLVERIEADAAGA